MKSPKLHENLKFLECKNANKKKSNGGFDVCAGLPQKTLVTSL